MPILSEVSVDYSNKLIRATKQYDKAKKKALSRYVTKLGKLLTRTRQERKIIENSISDLAVQRDNLKTVEQNIITAQEQV